ncbi:MAG: ABC transporter permease, partial [Desulfobulbaceae bacterium]|nr:ABC transporter permease [Desulfobulbaceae bacterium]
MLAGLKKIIVGSQGTFSLVNGSNNIRTVLALHRFHEMGQDLDRLEYKSVRRDPFTRLGEAVAGYFNDFAFMLTFLGATLFSFLHIIRHPGSLRRHDTLRCMQSTGVEALPIVGLISFLLGLIMAFMSSVQLQQFGANIYVASLVALSMTRELGPIMTAIIVAGRSSSAFAAEIGSMKISEEVDALFTMGFEPNLFLVMPKMVASLLVVPLLTLFSDLFAILGGLIVGVGMLDLTV